MSILTLKNRSAFENRTYQLFLGLGALSAVLTFFFVLNPSMQQVAESCVALFKWAVSSTQAFFAGPLALVAFYVHQRNWQASAWLKPLSKDDRHTRLRSCATYARLSRALSVLIGLYLPLSAFCLGYCAESKPWLETALGVMMLLPLTLLFQHKGKMLEWESPQEKGTSQVYACAASVFVGIGIWTGYANQPEASPEEAVVGMLLGIVVGIVFFGLNQALSLPAFTPRVYTSAEAAELP